MGNTDIQQLKDTGRAGSGKDERRAREDTWVRRLREGDRVAFEAIYRHYYPRLGQFLLRYLPSPGAAEDVIHTLFYRLWENRHRLEPRGTLKAYLYTAARNQALKYVRKQQKSTHAPLSVHPQLSAGSLLPEESLEYKEFSRAVQRAVGRLPERRRQIFLLHREDGLTYREIAEVLGISVKTVETQMSRSIKFLSEQLASYRE